CVHNLFLYPSYADTRDLHSFPTRRSSDLDGSRSGVLISNEEKKEDEQQETLTAFPTKRPQVLEADVVRFQNNKEKWIAFIGLISSEEHTSELQSRENLVCRLLLEKKKNTH